jgi:hypothetical protein
MKRSTINTTVGTVAGAAAGILAGFIAGAGLMAVKSGEDRAAAETGEEATVRRLDSPRADMGDVRRLPRSG